MNNETYNFVTTFTKKIKNKSDIEDVQQQVLLILIEKNLIDKELNEGLKNYIKGMIFNISTTIYNQFNKDTFPISNECNSIIDNDNDSEYLSESIEYTTTLSIIRKYIFENYYKKKKNLAKWRVFYLQLINNNYKFVSQRLNLNYSTCIEYNYQALKEIKQNLGTEIINKLNQIK